LQLVIESDKGYYLSENGIIAALGYLKGIT